MYIIYILDFTIKKRLKMSFYVQKTIDINGKERFYDIFRDEHPRGKVMSRAHIHTYHELLYITHGEVTLLCNNSTRYVLREGDVFFVPPGVVHSSHVSQSCPTDTIRTITAKFSTQMLLPLANTISDIQYLVGSESKYEDCVLFPSGSDAAALLAENLTSAVDEIEGEAPCFEIALRGYLSVLYANLMRVLPKNEPSGELHPNVSKKNTQLLCDALSYIEANYRNPMSIQQVADACGITYAQLTYLFSKCFVKGFSEYLLDLRITYAQKLLLQTNRSVTDIAIDCGFDNASYFTKKFKSISGMTPKEFRTKYLSTPQNDQSK
jgi:AraC-like DNA-binding protein